MKWDCDKRQRNRDRKLEDRLKRRKEWHRVFTWLPTKIGPGDCRWLEFVWRRQVPENNRGFYSDYKYYSLRFPIWEYKATVE